MISLIRAKPLMPFMSQYKDNFSPKITYWMTQGTVCYFSLIKRTPKLSATTGNHVHKPFLD